MSQFDDQMKKAMLDSLCTAIAIGVSCGLNRKKFVRIIDRMWQATEQQITQEKQHDSTDDKEAAERTDGNDTKPNPTV